MQDLFDDEENNLVGKHIEIYSQANKGWNTAYVLVMCGAFIMFYFLMDIQSG